MSNTDEYEKITYLIERKVAELAEYVDAVQIFASALQPNGTTKYWAIGSGNFFARKGQVDDWLSLNNMRLHEEVD
jgi:hypothetical protein